MDIIIKSPVIFAIINVDIPTKLKIAPNIKSLEYMLVSLFIICLLVKKSIINVIFNNKPTIGKSNAYIS